jgi:K+ transporter
MKLEQNLVFRKAAVPWYDSDVACAITAACMLIVFLFAIEGIYLARQLSQFRNYQWVPLLLAALSLTVLVSTLIRLIARRYSERWP